MLNEIRWGFIGCGKVVQKKSGKAFNLVNNSHIHSIMRRNLNDAHLSAKMFGVPYWYDNIEDFLASGIDAVYIATPPGLHFQQAMACCQAGKPIYIEKPFARSYNEARTIADAFSAKNIPLYVGHYRRALPRFIKIKQLLDEECIGKICSVDYQLNRIFSPADVENTWLYNPVLSGGGKFFDIAAHSLDIIAFLFGNLTDVYGYAKNHSTHCPLEDTVDFVFQTENDIVGTANFNCISNKKCDRMYVNGTNGCMEFSIHGRYDIKIINYNTETVDLLDIPDPVIIEGPMIQTVVDDLLQRGTCPCKAENALPTYYVIDRILEKFYQGRNDDFWNYPERWGN